MIQKRTPNSLKILMWNANGLHQKLNELQHFLQQHNIDIALISETHLNANKTVKVVNYNLYRNDRLNNTYGGTAIYVKKNIDHTKLPIPNLIQLESNGIEVYTKHGKIKIYAAYHSPKKTHLVQDLHTILSTNDSTIIAGDFNAKHSDWNSRVNNYNGIELQNYVNSHNVIAVGPTEPTHNSTVSTGDV